MGEIANSVKQAGKNKIKKIIIKSILFNPIFWVIAGVLLVILLITNIFSVESSAEETDQVNNVIKEIEIQGNKYVIKELTDEEEKLLEKMYGSKLDLSNLSDLDKFLLYNFAINGFDPEAYSKEEIECMLLFMKADFVSSHMKLGTDGVIDGSIEIVRSNSSNNWATLIYEEQGNFENWIDNNNQEALTHYTIDNNGNIVIASVGNQTMRKQIFNIQDFVSNVSVKFGFLNSSFKMCNMNDKTYKCWSDIANEVINTKIVIRVYDNTQTVTDTYSETNTTTNTTNTTNTSTTTTLPIIKLYSADTIFYTYLQEYSQNTISNIEYPYGVQPGTVEGEITKYEEIETINTVYEKDNNVTNEFKGKDATNGFYYNITKDGNKNFLDSISDGGKDLLFEMFDQTLDISAQTYKNIINYILWLYEGIDYGVTNLDLEFLLKDYISLNNGPSINSQALFDWIRSMEGHEGISADGQSYIVGLVNGNRTVGYGIDLDASGYDSVLIGMGYNTSKDALIPVSVIDNLEKEELNRCLQYVDSETNGLNLTIYQKYALVSRAYNCGQWGAIYKEYNGKKSFKEAYTSYWNDTLTEQNYKQSVNYNLELFTQCMAYPNTSNGIHLPGLDNRRQYEWQMFSTGYFHNSGTYFEEVSGYNQVILEKMDWLINILSGYGYGYNSICDIYGFNTQQPFIGDDGSIIFNTNRGISCATFVNEVLIHAGILNPGTTIWVGNNTVNNFRNRGVILEQITDKANAMPGDILISKLMDSAHCHICILTEINESTFKKLGSPEFVSMSSGGHFKYSNNISLINNYNIYRVTQSSNI